MTPDTEVGCKGWVSLCAPAATSQPLRSLTHPSVAVQPNSQFAAAYSKGINKLNYWEPVMEDSLDIIAKLPAIAALIYTNVYKGGNTIQADSKLDWAANLSHMMGMRSAQCGPPLILYATSLYVTLLYATLLCAR